MASTWDQIRTWNLVLPPSRPSAFHLEVIRRVLAARDPSSPVAILGCTPEFRDLLWEMKFTNVTLLERNLGFLRTMSQLRVYGNSEERIVAGDWLDTFPQMRNEFAVILSDLTMGNVPYERREEFYGAISKALAPGGYFIDKVLTHPAEHLPISDVLSKYTRMPMNLLHVNYFSCEAFFCSSLLDARGCVDSTLFYEILIDSTAAQPRVRAFVDATPQITPPGCVWYYGPKWGSLEEAYFRHLKCLTVTEDELHSPYYGRLKLFLCERR